MKRILKKLYSISLAMSILSLFSELVLGIYAFVTYTDSFFTTSSNYQHLSVTAPVLYKMSIFCVIVAVIAGLIAVSCYKIVTAKKRR